MRRPSSRRARLALALAIGAYLALIFTAAPARRSAEVSEHAGGNTAGRRAGAALTRTPAPAFLENAPLARPKARRGGC
jgi:hypothetical protein